MSAGRRPTLTRDLIGWVLGALLVVWGSFMVFGYRTGQHEADELTDGHLASVAALLLAHSLAGTPLASPMRVEARGELKAHDYQQSLSVAVWDAQGRLLARSGAAPLPGFDTPEGFSTLQLGGSPDRDWRVFARWDEPRSRRVIVLLSLRERDDLAQDIAEQVIEPGLWLLPVTALVLGFAIRRGLRPLYDLSRDVSALDIHHATPLPTRAEHEELRAAVDAINALVGRYHAALTRERNLAGEFAHELRTPLASLALQASNAARLPEGEDRSAALDRLHRDALRAGEVLSHLLSLARASRTELNEAARPVDLDAIARQVVADLAPAAHDSGRTLALSADGSFEADGHAVLLEMALRNLVENAISHTPDGAQVEVKLDAPGRWIEVRSEAGASMTQRPASGEPSSPARSLGLGLGHRVVEKIAAIHGAAFEERAGAGDGHRHYRISFPAGAARPASDSHSSGSSSA